MNPYNSHLDRRRFLKFSLASGATAGFGGWLRPASALAFGAQGALYRTLVPEGATAAAKGINAGWLASLRLREPAEQVFTKAANQLRYIGMPVGGICCGTLYLGGDGRLWLRNPDRSLEYYGAKQTLTTLSAKTKPVISANASGSSIAPGYNAVRVNISVFSGSSPTTVSVEYGRGCGGHWQMGWTGLVREQTEVIAFISTDELQCRYASAPC